MFVTTTPEITHLCSTLSRLVAVCQRHVTCYLYLSIAMLTEIELDCIFLSRDTFRLLGYIFGLSDNLRSYHPVAVVWGHPKHNLSYSPLTRRLLMVECSLLCCWGLVGG